MQKKTYTPDYLTHEKRANRGQVPLVTIQNHHEPIISREVWNLAQARIRQNNKYSQRTGSHSNRYVFSGKIRCAKCGSSFVGRFKYRKDGTKIRRWSCGTAAREGAQGCAIGKLVRDDDAMQMLKTALRSLSMDTEAIVRNVTHLALEAVQTGQESLPEDPLRLLSAIDRLQRKKERVMDSYFSGEIPKEDMQTMNRKYDTQLEDLHRRQKEAERLQKQHRDLQSLQEAIQAQVSGILKMETESQVFCKAMLESLTVFPDRHMELRLQKLPMVFHFLG